MHCTHLKTNTVRPIAHSMEHKTYSVAELLSWSSQPGAHRSSSHSWVEFSGACTPGGQYSHGVAASTQTERRSKERKKERKKARGGGVEERERRRKFHCILVWSIFLAFFLVGLSFHFVLARFLFHFPLSTSSSSSSSSSLLILLLLLLLS